MHEGVIKKSEGNSRQQRKSGSYKSVAAYGDAKPCSAQLYDGLGVDLHLSNA
jgi:hypothetical protein